MWGNVTGMPQAVGDLTVLLDNNDVDNDVGRKIWEKKGDQKKRWNKATVALNKQTFQRTGLRSGDDFGLTFVARRGYSYRSDIAIDEIVLTNSDCTAANDAIKEQGRNIFSR